MFRTEYAFVGNDESNDGTGQRVGCAGYDSTVSWGQSLEAVGHGHDETTLEVVEDNDAVVGVRSIARSNPPSTQYYYQAVVL
jgi:hypothetical protein